MKPNPAVFAVVWRVLLSGWPTAVGTDLTKAEMSALILEQEPVEE